MLQRKLTIGATNDPLELEADRVANQVLAASTHLAVGGAPPKIQRFTGQNNDQAMTAPASVDRVLASPGRPLDAGLQRDMGQRFGHDFSTVRVHSDVAAARSAQDVNAHAYTVGNNMVFGAGRFAPGTQEGRRLIAHELTHVVQQESAPNSSRAPLSIRSTSEQRVMRSLALDSTVKICRRVLESTKIKVSQGGLRVVLLLNQLNKEVPNCQNHTFGVTLTKSVDWGFDDEIASCEAETGGTRSFSFSNLSSGTYYLTIYRNFDNPYCCIEGDILAFDEPISADSPGCVRDKDPSALDIVHGALDIAGFIPVLGAVPDGINAIIYVAEGDWVNAGISTIAMIPAIGDGAKAAYLGGKTVVKVSAKASFKLGEEGLVKAFKEAKAASKIEKATLEAAETGEKALAKDAASTAAKDVSKISVEALLKVFRQGEKFRSVGAVSLKRLRNVLGRAGVSPSGYKLVKVPKEVAKAMEKEVGTEIWGWVSRSGVGEVAKDVRGRPIINFTPRALASLEEAVKTFGHEAQHLKDFAAGLAESSETLAERAGEKLWLIVEKSLTK